MDPRTGTDINAGKSTGPHRAIPLATSRHIHGHHRAGSHGRRQQGVPGCWRATDHLLHNPVGCEPARAGQPAAGRAWGQLMAVGKLL